jgi:hypothetical protein
MDLAMTTSRTSRFIAAAGALLAGAMLLASAAPLLAQGDQPDPRWQAWLGCWQPANVMAVDPGKTLSRRVCVVPAPGTSAVDVVTVADTLVISRERVAASGEPIPATRERCRGWETARWSPDGRRVYLSSGYACAGDVQRRSSGLMAISPRGEWLDVQAVTVGSRTGVRTLRYRAADPSVPLPREIAAALEGVDAEAGQARVAAAAALTTADVVEVSGQVDAQVVWAWLAERGEGFAVNARTLTEMADAGVPADVMDVVVALSYPRVFAINPATQQGEMRPEVAEGGAAPSAYGYAQSMGGYRFSPYGWDPYGWGYYSPFGYGSYGYYGPYGGYGYGPYGGYGYGPYGGHGYGPYGNGYYGGGVIITVVGGGQVVQPTTHGRVVNGRGYTQSSGTGREATAHPQSAQNTGSTPSSGASQSSGGTASPRSGSASPSSSSPSSSGSSSSTGRTAQPRPPQ